MMQMMKAGFTAQGGHNIMNKQDRKLIEKMMEYYAGDPKRVQHFLKVYEFAKLIGESEELEPEKLYILRTAAIVHDIGIKISEKKYGSSGGKYQEKEWDLTVSHRPQIGGKQVVEDICRESDADSHDIRVGILKDI